MSLLKVNEFPKDIPLLNRQLKKVDEMHAKLTKVSDLVDYIRFTLLKENKGTGSGSGSVFLQGVLGPVASTQGDFALFGDGTGNSIVDGGLSLDTDGTLAANSDTLIPSQKAVKTYVDSTPAGVTSVALTMPAEFSVAGSPITTSGTLAVTKANESANRLYAGPTTGAAAAPTFRAAVVADYPFHDEVLTDGASNIIYSGGQVVMVTGVPN